MYEKGSVLYVGDSDTDLLSLLEADCGVLIGGDRYDDRRPKNCHINLSNICGHFANGCFSTCFFFCTRYDHTLPSLVMQEFLR